MWKLSVKNSSYTELLEYFYIKPDIDTLTTMLDDTFCSTMTNGVSDVSITEASSTLLSDGVLTLSYVGWEGKYQFILEEVDKQGEPLRTFG